jgi:ribosomal protein S12 methylthiotransferase
MARQAKISADKLAHKVGRTLTVLVDTVTDAGAVARSGADAPEIDGVVYIEPSPNLKPGEFCQVKITRAGDHDLWAEVVSGKARS